MCGIVGFSGKPDSYNLEKMASSILHRGPDDNAYIVNSSFSVGFRRLSIIDLSENIYPIENETSTIELVLNGEIYNYLILRSELISLGHKFKTKSDSEVLVHAYEQWGYAMLEKLRGMFVFVLLDKATNKLFIARDRLGIKPFYYTKIEDRWVFGSEIKSILTGFDYIPSANSKSIYKFLTSRIHDDTEETFFENIYRLMPAHFMVLDAEGNMDIQKYWEVKVNPNFSSNKKDIEYAKEFQEIFRESVDLHLISDVPLGITLSGGLDSSGIAIIASEILKKQNIRLNTFSAIHPGKSINEEKYIDIVNEKINANSTKIIPNVDKFWEDLEDWIYTQEEPVISSAPYAYHVVMQEARKKVTVLLSGQGGDELMAGYIPYFLTYIYSAIDQKKYINILKESFLGRDLYFKFFLDKIISLLQKNRSVVSIHSLLNPKFRAEFSDSKDIAYSRNLNQRLADDVFRLTTPSLLRYEDKNSMANSIESRVPYFDHKLVEYIFSLPIDQKIKNGWNRYAYRNAMANTLPEKIKNRRSKVGFTNPEWEWIVSKSENFKKIFKSNLFISREYWNAKLVLENFEKDISSNVVGDVLIYWRIFIVEMWLRRFIIK